MNIAFSLLELSEPIRMSLPELAGVVPGRKVACWVKGEILGAITAQ